MKKGPAWLLPIVVILMVVMAPAAPSRAEPGDIRKLASSIELAAPAGWSRWCRDARSGCTARAPESAVATPALSRLLAAIFADVNRRVTPLAEPPGSDDWRPIDGTGAGDCEDFALTYAAALLAAGVPRGALELALALTEDGEPHVVLAVATSAGTVVLDNRAPTPLPWRRLPYRWLALQGAHTTGWQLLRPTHAVDVARTAAAAAAGP
jgi:predicted transglutaminase-like cysteine proteinase